MPLLNYYWPVYTQCRWARLVTVCGVCRSRRLPSSVTRRRICYVTHQGAVRVGGLVVLRPITVRATPFPFAAYPAAETFNLKLPLPVEGSRSHLIIVPEAHASQRHRRYLDLFSRFYAGLTNVTNRQTNALTAHGAPNIQ